jgi:ferredoxin-type protein NapH
MVKLFQIKRIIGYMIGFFLFYAPFALYQKTFYALMGVTEYADIHDFCLRIPLEHIWQGRIFQSFTVSAFSILLCLSAAFFFGAVFCGRLCIVGSIGEYLSRLLPDRFQIDWVRYLSPVPVRYGILTGFFLSPFLGGYLACAYCGYRLVEAASIYIFLGEVTILPSSVLFTGMLWLLVFGIFTKGGRGFCNYMCPVGAAQNAMHWLGCRFSFVWRIQIDAAHCLQCGQCVRVCPMQTLQIDQGELRYDSQHCITCMQCREACPTKCITYGPEKGKV